MFILDTNILLYAVNQRAAQHPPTVAFLTEAAANREVVGLPWVSILGFVRISTRPQVFDAPLTATAAMEMVQSWLTHPQFRTIEPGARHSELMAELMEGRGWVDPTDVHIAALARERGASVVSFDRDFARFGVPTVVPGRD